MKVTVLQVVAHFECNFQIAYYDSAHMDQVKSASLIQDLEIPVIQISWVKMKEAALLGGGLFVQWSKELKITLYALLVFHPGHHLHGYDLRGYHLLNKVQRSYEKYHELLPASVSVLRWLLSY